MKKFSLFFHFASRHIEPRSTPEKKRAPRVLLKCAAVCVCVWSALEKCVFCWEIQFQWNKWTHSESRVWKRNEWNGVSAKIHHSIFCGVQRTQALCKKRHEQWVGVYTFYLFDVMLNVSLIKSILASSLLFFMSKKLHACMVHKEVKPFRARVREWRMWDSCKVIIIKRNKHFSFLLSFNFTLENSSNRFASFFFLLLFCSWM